MTEMEKYIYLEQEQFLLIYIICVLPVPDFIKINKFKFSLMLKEKKNLVRLIYKVYKNIIL